MGSGVLKILSSYKVSEDQFLYVFSCGGHSSEPRICLLLWRLSYCLCGDNLVSIDAPVVYHRVTSLAGSLDPVLTIGLVVIALTPCVLGTVTTKMSFFMARIALNFA